MTTNLLRRKLARYGILACLTTALLFCILVGLQPPSSNAANDPLLQAAGDSLTKDRDLSIYLEALAKINEQARFLKNPLPRDQMVRDTLRSYLAKHDAFSDILSAEEFARLQQLQTDHYFGVGMEIERAPNGTIVCFPYAGSPAQRAGIKPDDELETINDVAIQGMSLVEISMMSMGKTGTHVKFGINRKGDAHNLDTVIGNSTFQAVSKVREGPFSVITLHAFTAQTKSVLQSQIEELSDRPIIIDLRMNRGGDFYTAVDTAKLFLHKGDTVVSIRSRTGTKDYTVEQDGIYSSVLIYLWQDEQTASAAELFIAALTDNRRAHSIGRRTFGKGIKQDLIKLSDGSVLMLSTGSLLTPKGLPYDKRGIDPTYILTGDKPDTGAYIKKLTEVLH